MGFWCFTNWFKIFMKWSPAGIDSGNDFRVPKIASVSGRFSLLLFFFLMVLLVVSSNGHHLLELTLVCGTDLDWLEMVTRKAIKKSFLLCLWSSHQPGTYHLGPTLPLSPFLEKSIKKDKILIKYLVHLLYCSQHLKAGWNTPHITLSLSHPQCIHTLQSEGGCSPQREHRYQWPIEVVQASSCSRETGNSTNRIWRGPKMETALLVSGLCQTMVLKW